jgi:hypothetical protein
MFERNSSTALTASSHDVPLQTLINRSQVPLPKKGFRSMGIDLDKILAEEEESRSPYEFTFDSEVYTLPPAMDVRAIAAIAGGRLDSGLSLLLGEEQWTKMQASPKVLTVTALEKLFDAYAEYSGATTLGGLSASTS